MDATNRFDRTVDRKSSWSLLPFEGHAGAAGAAAHASLAPKSLPCLAEAPKESSSVSDGPGPGDPPDSDGPELRFDETPDGHGYYTRDGFLRYYGDIDGAARWERAAVYGSGASSDSPAVDSSDDGANDADDSGADVILVVG